MATFDPTVFMAQLQGDGVRPNLFQVTMPFPAIITGGAAASQKLTFTCRAAELPASTVGTVPVYYQGREVKLAGNRTFADWPITIINDTDFLVRNTFERWNAAINAFQANVRNPAFANLGAYSTNPTVSQLDLSLNAIKTYNFYGCWPSTVDGIGLDWSNNDALEEFGVTMVVQFFTDAKNGIV